MTFPAENSERGIRVLAGCRIIIFRKAVKQCMASLQDDINIMWCGTAADFISWWPSWIWLKNQVYTNILGTKPISCLRRKIFYEYSIHFSTFDAFCQAESLACKLVTYEVINRPNSFQPSTSPAKVCLRNKGHGIKSLWIPGFFLTLSDQMALSPENNNCPFSCVNQLFHQNPIRTSVSKVVLHLWMRLWEQGMFGFVSSYTLRCLILR